MIQRSRAAAATRTHAIRLAIALAISVTAAGVRATEPIGDAQRQPATGRENGRDTSAPATNIRHLFANPHAHRGAVIATVDRAAARDAAAARRSFVVPGVPLSPSASVALELRPFPVTAKNMQVVLGRRDAADIPFDYQTGRVAYFTGTVTGAPGSSAFLAVSDRSTVGSIDLGPGKPVYRLATNRTGTATASDASAEVAIFEAAATGPALDVPRCGFDLIESAASREAPTRPASVKTHATQRAGGTARANVRTIELAIETDYEFYEIFGNPTDATTYIEMLIGAVNHIYLRDVDHRYEITFIRLWDTPDDLYNSEGTAALSDFVTHWQTQMGSVPRDTAHYLSGRRDLPFGGIAYLSQICGSFGYGMSAYLLGYFPDLDEPSVYHYDVGVVAHELGHNCSSPHTDAYVPPVDQCYPNPNPPQRGTIMSYCSQAVSGGNKVEEERFHATVQLEMESFLLNEANCIIDDCNMNGTADSQDIFIEFSADANNNGVPDECEDCDNNGVLDPADIAGGADDQNFNGIPDICEPDCNNNGRVDEMDIVFSTSDDAYGNNIPDECETDCNNNGISDFNEIQADLTLDINRNAILDACEDCDGDGTLDADEMNGANNLWIASDLDDSLVEFHGETGVVVRRAEAGHLQLPQDVEISETGRIFVSSGRDDRIAEFDRTGAFVGDFVPAGGGGLSFPTGLLIHDNGNLLVSSRDTNSVIEYDLATGAKVRDFVASAGGGLLSPFGLAQGRGGNIFVAGADNQVREYDGDTGAFLGIFVSAADNGGLGDPRCIAFKRDGHLLVAGYASDAVHEYDGTGAYLRVFHDGGTVYGAWGVDVTPNGNVMLTRDFEGVVSETGQPTAGTAPLHASTTRIYEYNARTGWHLRSYLLGDDTGFYSPTGFDFMPGGGTDCNFNFLPDACDIAAGEPDIDLDGIPDACQRPIPVAPQKAYENKQSRYLTIAPPSTSAPTALRVSLDVLHNPASPPLGTPDFTLSEGGARWVGPPIEHPQTSAPTPTYFAAQLQCEPYFADWSAFDEISIYGDAIVPDSTYAIQAVDQSFEGALDNESSYSFALAMRTAAHGDVVAPFDPGALVGQPDINDILAIVDQFLGSATPPKASAQMFGNVPNPALEVDLNDILLCIDAFLGLPYPYEGPSACP